MFFLPPRTFLYSGALCVVFSSQVTVLPQFHLRPFFECISLAFDLHLNEAEKRKKKNKNKIGASVEGLSPFPLFPSAHMRDRSEKEGGHWDPAQFEIQIFDFDPTAFLRHVIRERAMVAEICWRVGTLCGTVYVLQSREAKKA